jgi:hypothetical protein
MRRLAHFLLVLLFIIAFVDASSSQLQMLVMGRVAMPEYLAKIGVFAVVVAYWAISPKRRIDKSIKIAWIALACTLAVCTVVIAVRGTIGLGEQLSNLAVNYLYMLCLPICLLCAKPFLRLNVILKTLAILLVPLCLLGVAQYVLADPIIATDAADGSFRVVSWQFQERVRAFSLFASSFAFSCFLAIMAGYCTAYLVGSDHRKRVRLVALGGCVLIAAATYATITRLGFLFVTLAALFGVVLSRVRQFNRLTWACLPLIGLAVATSTLLLAPIITSATSSNLVADDTLIDRLFHWAQAVSTWTNNGIATFLCGTGISQGSSNADYIVDNTFLNFAVQAGVLGLLASVAFMYTIWMSFRRAINKKSSPAVVALCAFWGTWMLTGMINWTNPTYALVAAPFMISWDFP